MCLSFKVFLINTETQTHNQENRQLRFWFMANVSESDKMRFAQQFFRDLVNPTNFPRDYIGFIMKIMKLMQIKYTNIRQIEVELKLVQELSEPPSRPSESFLFVCPIIKSKQSVNSSEIISIRFIR